MRGNAPLGGSRDVHQLADTLLLIGNSLEDTKPRGISEGAKELRKEY